MSQSIMPFASGGASSADKVSYNNATSGLSADNVQSAIDEVKSDFDVINEAMSKNKVNFLRIVPSSYGNVIFMRKGDLCVVGFNSTTKVIPSSWTDICAIPNGYKPAKQLLFPCTAGDTFLATATLTLGTSPTVRVTNPNGKNYLMFDFTYYTNDDYPLGDEYSI